jgi:carboxylate-amine ligase
MRLNPAFESLRSARSARSAPLRAFQGYGIELEYMIVHQDSLDVYPIADRVLEGDMLEHGDAAWSNELTAHVLEVKNPRPGSDLEALARSFHLEIRKMNAALRDHGARLMPTGMHPWMNPGRETRLWPRGEPQGSAAIYQTYDRIFDCHTHGWANLQSMHVNMPFSGDREFGRLHAAIRLALPILPAIAASSPFVEGRAPGPLDCRLDAYRASSNRIPAMTGQVIPETVRTRAHYERRLLRPLYLELAPLDPYGVLRHEWANARGAIARFDRHAIEIRLLDVQECPSMDLALAAAVIDLVCLLYREGPRGDVATEELARILGACINDAERARIDSAPYLRALGLGAEPCEAVELWRRLATRMAGAAHHEIWQPSVDFILAEGPLARRLLRAAAPAGGQPSRAALARLYARLCECLDSDRAFHPSSLS